jgi:hypothetical protein
MPLTSGADRAARTWIGRARRLDRCQQHRCVSRFGSRQRNPLLRVAGIADELRQLPGVRVDLVTSPGRATYAEVEESEPTWNASRNVASIAAPDYFEAPQGADARLAVKRCREALAAFEALTLAADSEDDGTMGDWTSSGGRPPMTGHLWADALMGVAIALLLMWLLLGIVLAVGRPKGKLLSESIRLLPDLLRLQRRLAVDRSRPETQAGPRPVCLATSVRLS